MDIKHAPTIKKKYQASFFIAVLLIYAAINCFMNYKLKTTSNKQQTFSFIFCGGSVITESAEKGRY